MSYQSCAYEKEHDRYEAKGKTYKEARKRTERTLNRKIEHHARLYATLFQR